MRVSAISSHFCSSFNPIIQSKAIVNKIQGLDQKRIDNVPWSKEDYNRAGSYQKYRGLTELQIRQGWSKIGREAASIGTLFHRVAEQLVIGSDNLTSAWATIRTKQHTRTWEQSNIAPELRNLRQLLLGMHKGGWLPIHVELKVAAFGITGTIDAVFRHRKTGSYRIIDWKRSKGDVFHTINRCKYPMNSYTSNKRNQWSLQLNLYGLLFCEERSISMDNTQLVCVRFYNNNAPVIHIAKILPKRLLVNVIGVYKRVKG